MMNLLLQIHPGKCAAPAKTACESCAPIEHKLDRDSGTSTPRVRCCQRDDGSGRNAVRAVACRTAGAACRVWLSGGLGRPDLAKSASSEPLLEALAKCARAFELELALGHGLAHRNITHPYARERRQIRGHQQVHLIAGI